MIIGVNTLPPKNEAITQVSSAWAMVDFFLKVTRAIIKKKRNALALPPKGHDTRFAVVHGRSQASVAVHPSGPSNTTPGPLWTFQHLPSSTPDQRTPEPKEPVGLSR